MNFLNTLKRLKYFTKYLLVFVILELCKYSVNIIKEIINNTETDLGSKSPLNNNFTSMKEKYISFDNIPYLLEKFEENKKAFTDLTTQSDYTELTKELYEGSF